jgi:hypothetical protein
MMRVIGASLTRCDNGRTIKNPMNYSFSIDLSQRTRQV